MPHCIIEYSKTLEARLTPSALIEAVHHGALKSELFEGADIKTRAVAYEHYRTGAGTLDFVHITARILSGRNQQQKAALSDRVLAELKAIVSVPASLTVEVCDIDRVSYAKSVTG
ncbi:5-carboxymethyl-2-hydroxymuconate Delta-isomerase [Marinobacterium arenosum]|uniref:5-carboxymethyl-2-hydroxymuconate Delta-isomerase n=1 Tax=Marinobacterium arenosum TaxID=2862496 RepID=UPI001C950666|nr:5-carboxymethyl-2-hydroxymuconate Delta-isomerase [Marinobacterium arenosum]MBY4678425.1 5-carboxymethyl-2-hydroxymuconate Delta-isomerase [Marinobacterium arenosum]